MKRTLTILSLAFGAMLILNSYSTQAPTNGSKGYTGSPNDGNNCTHCHTGTALPVNGMITTNIPTGGWVAGQTYDITFTISENGVSRFGFQMTAEDASGNSIGSFSATSATTLQNGGSHITHKSSSTAGSGSKAWTVSWTAPTAGSGTVTFYGAGNATNSSSSVQGDLIKTSSTSVDENTSTNVALVSTRSHIKVYPNPVQDQFTIEAPEGSIFHMYTLGGTQVKSDVIQEFQAVDVSDLDPGVYVLQIPEVGFQHQIVIQ